MKRDICNIMKNGGIALLLFAFICGSCNQEPIPGKDEKDGDPVTVKVMIPRSITWQEWPETVGGDSNGVYPTVSDGIEDFYLFAFAANSEEIKPELTLKFDFNDPEDPGFTPSTTLGEFGSATLEMYPGIYHFISMVNMKKTYGTAIDAATTKSELEKIPISEIESIEDPIEEGYFPLGKVLLEREVQPAPRTAFLDYVYIGKGADPENPVSFDGGKTWLKELPLDMERIFSIFNISVRKMTGDTDGTHAKDKIDIHSVRLLQVPNSAYMRPAPYKTNGAAYKTLPWYKYDLAVEGERDDNDFFRKNNNGGVEDPEAETTVTIGEGDGREIYARLNTKDVLIPEYIMSAPTSAADAILLELRGDYYHYKGDAPDWIDDEPKSNWGSLTDVWGVVPIHTGTVGSSHIYETYRNVNYEVTATITGVANFHFDPRLTIVASAWEESSHFLNIGNANLSLASQSWSPSGPTVNLDFGRSVTYTFQFSRPAGQDTTPVRWSAELSDPVHFKFIEKKTNGYSELGQSITLTVTPKAATDVAGKSTTVAIHVEDGVGGTIKLTPTPNTVINQNIQ